MLFLQVFKLSALTPKVQIFSKLNYYLRNITTNMTTKCEVAVCQFTASNDKEKNIGVIRKLVSQAVDQSAKVVFLPEASDYIANNKVESKSLSEPLSGPLISQYKQLAKSNNIWLSIGGFHEKQIDDDVMYNSHILIDNEGNIRSTYRKIHLFDVSIPEKNVNLKESEYVKGGCQILPPVATPAGNLALSICYDLRFPEISTLQTKLGAEILTYPSAFTQHTGAAHWEIMLRARAIENQCYVVAAAQYGKHNDKRTSYGQALIADPWGRIIAECPKYSGSSDPDTNESIAVATIDLEYLKNVRLNMPTFQHRRNDIYNLNLIQNQCEVKDDEILYFADKEILGSTVFLKTKYCYAFTNIRCVVPGHVLVATLRPTQRLQDLSQEEISDLFQTAIKVSTALEVEYNAGSSTVCVQDGKFAGQTVPHVHVHILPRKLGDFQKNDDIYLHLANHDKQENSNPFRPKEEMVREAQKLKHYFS